MHCMLYSNKKEMMLWKYHEIQFSQYQYLFLLLLLLLWNSLEHTFNGYISTSHILENCQHIWKVYIPSTVQKSYPNFFKEFYTFPGSQLLITVTAQQTLFLCWLSQHSCSLDWLCVCLLSTLSRADSGWTPIN